MIRRRSSASSSFVLGYAASGLRLRALQLDPSHATARTGNYEEFRREAVMLPPDDGPHVTGTEPHALLTRPAPMGASMSARSEGLEPPTF